MASSTSSSTESRLNHSARDVDTASRERRLAGERLDDASVRADMQPEDEAALARTHERVIDAERKVSGLRSRSGQRKLAEAEMTEMAEARSALLDAALGADRRAADQALVVAARVLDEAGPDAHDLMASLLEPSSTVHTARPGWSEIDAEAIEFYLLARLAAQRQVSYAGSVPMIIDDAMAGVPAADVRRILQGLGKMAESVQIVFMTDDPVVMEWAESRPDDASATGTVASVAESVL